MTKVTSKNYIDADVSQHQYLMRMITERNATQKKQTPIVECE